MINVVFCIPGRTFTYKFVHSWSNLLSLCPTKFGVSPTLSMAYTNNIYVVRDLCLNGDENGPANQKPFGGKLNYDYIMWIDSDSVFQPQQFKTLLDQMEENKKYHILAGLYLLDDGRYATHYDPEISKKDAFITPADVKKGLGTKPFKVLYTGMGFMLVRRGVFETLTYPWFMPMSNVNSKGAKILIGDDAGFCVRAKQAGFDIWVDPRVMIGHEKPKVLI